MNSVSTSDTTATEADFILDVQDADSLVLTCGSTSDATTAATTVGSGNTSYLAKGITLHADGSFSGYYDVNKVWNDENGEPVDNYMCWAASASNILAWWQQTYFSVNLDLTTNPPTDAEDIFSAFKLTWGNTGGSTATACTWWLFGLENKANGAYYSAESLKLNADKLISSYSLTGRSATDTATLLANTFAQGGMVELGIAPCTDYDHLYGHAITCWGVSVDETTGLLSKIYVTDSDDKASGMLVVDVYYDKATGSYIMQGDRFQNYYLRDADILRAATSEDTTAPAEPTALTASVNRVEVTFSWTGTTDSSDVYYEFQALIKDVSGKYYYASTEFTTSSYFTTTLSAAGEYLWRVRAVDYAGNASEWVTSDVSFNYTQTAPIIGINEPSKEVISDGKTEVIFSWAGSSGLSYKLYLNGVEQKLSSPSDTSYTATLEDGNYEFYVTGTDAYGYTVTSYTETFTCDTVAPTAPTNLKAVQQGNTVVFTWDPASDANGIKKYFFAYFAPGDTTGVYDWDVEGTSYTLEVSTEGSYSWYVSSLDGAHNQSGWTAAHLSVDLTPPTLFNLSTTSKKLSEGNTQVTFTWDANADATSYTLEVNGVTYTTSEKAYTLTLTDGGYSYSVTASDAKGNTITKSGESFTLDATAPAVALNEPTLKKQETGKTEVHFKWSSNDKDASYTLTVDGQTYNVGKTTDYDLSGLADGTHSYAVTATDTKGNSKRYEGSFTTDNTPPTLIVNDVTIGTKGDGEAEVTFSWSATGGATRYQLTVDGQTYDLTTTKMKLTLKDGTHNYTVTAWDAADNKVSDNGKTFTLDTTAPALKLNTPTIKKLGTGLSEVIISWSIDNEDVTYELNVNGTIYKDLRSPQSYRLELADGDYTYTLKAIDKAGNSTKVTGEHFTLDTTPPTITLHKPESAKVSDGYSNVTFSWTSNDKNATFSLQVDNAVYNNITGTSFTVQGLRDGEHHYTLIATDANGNEAHKDASLDLDTIAPVITHVNVNREKVETGKTLVTLSWDCNEEAEYAISIKGDHHTLMSHSITELTHAHVLEDDHYIYTLTAKDKAGHISVVSTGEFTCDATPPTLTLKEPQLKPQGGGKASVTLSWEAAGASRYEVFVDGEKKYSGDKASCTLTLTDGKHSYSVTAWDAAGNKTQKSDDMTLDSSAPELTRFDVTQEKVAGTTGKTKVTFSWASNESATYTLTITGGSGAPIVKTLTEQTSSLTLADGTYSYSLTATDKAGNVSEARTGSLTCDATPPALTLQKEQVQEKSDGSASVTLSWSAPGATRYTLTVDGAEVYSGTDTSRTLTLKAGTHNYSITAWDAAGNSTEKEASLEFGVIADVKVLKSTNKGKGTVQISWAGEEGATYELSLGGKTYKLGKKTSWKGSLADSVREYTLRTYKDGQLVSTRTNTHYFDFTAPALSDIQVETDSKTKITTLSWKGDDGVTFDIMKGKKLITSVENASGCTLNLADGKYSYTLVATDAAGNSSKTKLSFKVDTTPVTLKKAKASVKKGKTPGSATVSLSWKGESKATYTVKVYDTMGTADTSDDTLVRTEANLRKSSVKLTNMAEKNGASAYRYTIEAWDQAGNYSMLNSTDPLVVDTIKPLFADLSAPAKKAIINTTATLSWTGVVGETYTLKVGKVTETIIGKGELITRSFAADGKYSYTLTAVDQGKNKASVKGSFTVDTTAPNLSKVSAKKGKVRGDEMQVTLSWKGESKAAYSLTGDDVSYSGKKTSSKLNLGTGTHIYTLTATDLAGNASSLAVTLTVDVATKSVSVSTASAASRAVASPLDSELAISAGHCALCAEANQVLSGMSELSLNAEAEKKQDSYSLLA